MDATENILTQEEDMSQRSRRGFLLSLIVPLTLAQTACSSRSPSEQVADKFMDAYYVKFSVAEALPLSADLAKEKLQGQLQLLQGAGGSDPAQDKPQVSYKLINRGAGSADTATYVYEIHAQVQDLGKRMVFVKLRNEGGQWLVTQFTENDAPPN
jgi:hypothetical protein